MSSNKLVVESEIRHLDLRIAVLKYDYEVYRYSGASPAYLAVLAIEITELSFQRECLRIGNYNKLPYSIKMLVNGLKK